MKIEAMKKQIVRIVHSINSRPLVWKMMYGEEKIYLKKPQKNNFQNILKCVCIDYTLIIWQIVVNFSI